MPARDGTSCRRPRAGLARAGASMPPGESGDNGDSVGVPVGAGANAANNPARQPTVDASVVGDSAWSLACVQGCGPAATDGAHLARGGAPDRIQMGLAGPAAFDSAPQAPTVS